MLDTFGNQLWRQSSDIYLSQRRKVFGFRIHRGIVDILDIRDPFKTREMTQKYV